MKNKLKHLWCNNNEQIGRNKAQYHSEFVCGAPWRLCKFLSIHSAKEHILYHPWGGLLLEGSMVHYHFKAPGGDLINFRQVLIGSQ